MHSDSPAPDDIVLHVHDKIVVVSICGGPDVTDDLIFDSFTEALASARYVAAQLLLCIRCTLDGQTFTCICRDRRADAPRLPVA